MAIQGHSRSCILYRSVHRNHNLKQSAQVQYNYKLQYNCNTRIFFLYRSCIAICAYADCCNTRKFLCYVIVVVVQCGPLNSGMSRMPVRCRHFTVSWCNRSHELQRFMTSHARWWHWQLIITDTAAALSGQRSTLCALRLAACNEEKEKAFVIVTLQGVSVSIWLHIPQESYGYLYTCSRHTHLASALYTVRRNYWTPFRQVAKLC